jgi:hypothetical protein
MGKEGTVLYVMNHDLSTKISVLYILVVNLRI